MWSCVEFNWGRRAYFFFNETTTTDIYTLSLHDALPISYRELRERVDRVAAGLHQLGIGPGDVVTIQLPNWTRSEEHTSELQSHSDLVCRLLLEKKNTRKPQRTYGMLTTVLYVA